MKEDKANPKIEAINPNTVIPKQCNAISVAYSQDTGNTVLTFAYEDVDQDQGQRKAFLIERVIMDSASLQILHNMTGKILKQLKGEENDSKSE